MAPPKASIESVSLTAHKHIYDGTADGVKFQFIDNNGNQSVDGDDSLDFFFQLSQYNYPICQDILKDKTLQTAGKSCKNKNKASPECIAKAAINTCKKMKNIEYKKTVENAVKSFHGALEAELLTLMKSLSSKEPGARISKLCEDIEEESAYFGKDGLQITDIDSNGTADDAAFQTTNGISVTISAIIMSCTTLKQKTLCCNEVDTQRTGVAKYLGILDPLFDYF